MRSADLAGKRVAILGLGREGRVARTVALQNDANSVMGIDDQAGSAFEAWLHDFPDTPAVLSGSFLDENVHADEREHRSADQSLNAIDVVIKSPGVSKYHPLVKRFRAANIPVTGSTQLWLADYAENTVAVTGSKGKSTTATLIHHLMTALLDRDAGFGGNIGIPMFEVAPASRYVVEFGSYQSSEVLDSPETVVLTSLFPEHLDWHGSEEEYFKDKLNLAAHGAKRIIVNARDSRLLNALSAYYPTLNFERCGPGEGVELVSNGVEEVFSYQGTTLFPASTLQLVGAHNRWNAALALTWLAGEIDILAERERVQNALSTFQALDHRLTAYLSGGLTFIDDTLSTSPYATIAALESFPGEVITLMLGGQDRGVDYLPLVDRLRQDDIQIQGIVWLPGSSERLKNLVIEEISVPSKSAETMFEAVTHARELSQPDSIVLLSPAAPSYGHFVDYRDRAEQFISAVLETDHTDDASGDESDDQRMVDLD